MIPVVLLDVDGVVNALSAHFPSTSFEGTWHKSTCFCDGDPFIITWSTVVRDFLLELDRVAEIRWHTTWQLSAHRISIALDLPKWEIADAPEFIARHSSDYWWKHGAAIRVVADEGRPLIWLDDDLYHFEVEYFKSVRRTVPEADFCLIKPDSNIGLSKKNLKTIWDFCEKYQEHDTADLQPSS